ncbi:ammonium transporter [Tengunoibacter tsumagoiensis]|uniref:Ammonium transporter n=1 Tax=Tengunoibacter tsumagoiensis TaxID=2014871 RepID=A0A402A1A7_9CHLR|nr:ammonium transporter [Tengunoibacter tsumagoiensis]GCE12928.1 ammonium transporter [Tengunoibacter tsumagoiensis]
MTSLLSSAWVRFKTNLRDPLVRRNVALYMGGKLLGLTLVLLAINFFVPTAIHAATGRPAADVPTINAVNTVWTLVAAFLVFGMQVGFVMLEAGFARSRESVNILVEGIADTCICGVLFWAWGFAFMFDNGNGFIGTQGFFLNGMLGSTYQSSGIPVLAFWVFQFAFADTASTITSGAMIGRCGFWGDIVYSIGVTGFIYPIIGHWAWGPDGWLVALNFHDFAGSTVVHSIGGAISLAGAIALGPRLGRVFKRDGGGPPPAHDLIIGAVGGLILWFGWYGFNPGSTLSALDAVGIGRVSFNTTLAACSGGLIALFYSYFRSKGKSWDLGLTVNGFLGGLVAITCPCYWVDPVGAFFIGAVAAIVVALGLDLLEYLRIDDPIGAVPVHLFAGIWGTLSLGLFATGAYSAPTPTGAATSGFVSGLFYGGGASQLVAQLIGSGAVVGATLVVSLIMMFALKAIGILRVSKEGELEGLDLHEHGAVAYPEYALMGLAPSLAGPATHLSGASEESRVLVED